MSDTRPRVKLNGKRIDLAQLAKEVGAPLSASETEVVVADPDSTVTAAALSKALAGHTPPSATPIEPPLTDDERRRLRALLAR
jgi:hypothetical protein